MKYPKILIIFGCLALILTGYFVGVYAQRQRNRPTQSWLLSQTSYIQLGVWDKFNTSNSNKVTFVATNSQGKQYKSEKHSSQDDWIYTTFREDFEPYLENQTVYSSYSWKCVADGKVVASGQFEYGNFQADTSSAYR